MVSLQPTKKVSLDTWDCTTTENGETVRIRFDEPELLRRIDKMRGADRAVMHLRELAQTRRQMDDLERKLPQLKLGNRLHGGMRKEDIKTALRDRLRRIRDLVGRTASLESSCIIARYNDSSNSIDCSTIVEVRQRWTGHQLLKEANSLLKLVGKKDNDASVHASLQRLLRGLDAAVARDKQVLDTISRQLNFETYWNPQNANSALRMLTSGVWMLAGATLSVYAQFHVVLSAAYALEQGWALSMLQEVATYAEDATSHHPWIMAGLQLVGLPYWGEAPPRPPRLEGERKELNQNMRLPSIGDLMWSYLPQFLNEWAFKSCTPKVPEAHHWCRVAVYDLFLLKKKAADISPAPEGLDDTKIRGAEYLTIGLVRNLVDDGEKALEGTGLQVDDVLRGLGIHRWVPQGSKVADTSWALRLRSLGELLTEGGRSFNVFSFVDIFFAPIRRLWSYAAVMPQLPDGEQFVKLSTFGIFMWSLLPFVKPTTDMLTQQVRRGTVHATTEVLRILHYIIYNSYLSVGNLF